MASALEITEDIAELVGGTVAALFVGVIAAVFAAVGAFILLLLLGSILGGSADPVSTVFFGIFGLGFAGLGIVGLYGAGKFMVGNVKEQKEDIEEELEEDED